VLLRPGVLTHAQIEAACGQKLLRPQELPDAAPRASGTLESHYAPTAKVRLMDAKSLQTALDLLGEHAPHIGVYATTPLKSRADKVRLRRMPADAAEVARQLFAVLRDFDAQGVQLIWVETPPDAPQWDGVRDRLRRASAA
jgi:L-threonylcarbamoyladenylate synthase